MDAHDRSVVETNKVNVCVVVDICVFINALGIYLLSVTALLVTALNKQGNIAFSKLFS